MTIFLEFVMLIKVYFVFLLSFRCAIGTSNVSVSSNVMFLSKRWERVGVSRGLCVYIVVWLVYLKT